MKSAISAVCLLTLLFTLSLPKSGWAGEFKLKGAVTASLYPSHGEYDPSPNVPFEERYVGRYGLEIDGEIRNTSAPRWAVFFESHSVFGDSLPQTRYNYSGPWISTYLEKGIGYDMTRNLQTRITSGENYGSYRYKGEERQWWAVQVKWKFSL